MKIRTGFVSNSSTASFIVDLDTYQNTVALARKMLKIMIKDEDGNLEEDQIELFEDLLDRLNAAEEAGLEPNSAIMFPTFNFETFIVKKEDGYYVDTDFGVDWGDFLEGTGEIDNEVGFDLTEEGHKFYIIEHDIIGKFIRVYPETTPCETGDHDSLCEGVELPDGRLVCLECEADKLKPFKITK